MIKWSKCIKYLITVLLCAVVSVSVFASCDDTALGGGNKNPSGGGSSENGGGENNGSEGGDPEGNGGNGGENSEGNSGSGIPTVEFPLIPLE